MASRLRVYGESLLHPVALCALALWAINDHYGKGAWPAWLSGKLSDVSCLIVIPLLCAAGVELVGGLFGRSLTEVSRWGVFACDLGALVAAVIMVGINLWPSWAYVYELGLGAAQWAALVPVRLLFGQEVGQPYLVTLTMDPSDLITVPSALIGPWVHRQVNPTLEGCN